MWFHDFDAPGFRILLNGDFATYLSYMEFMNGMRPSVIASATHNGQTIWEDSIIEFAPDHYPFGSQVIVAVSPYSVQIFYTWPGADGFSASSTNLLNDISASLSAGRSSGLSATASTRDLNWSSSGFTRVILLDSQGTSTVLFDARVAEQAISSADEVTSSIDQALEDDLQLQLE